VLFFFEKRTKKLYPLEPSARHRHAKDNGESLFASFSSEKEESSFLHLNIFPGGGDCRG
jgi:hypothetical protein